MNKVGMDFEKINDYPGSCRAAVRMLQNRDFAGHCGEISGNYSIRKRGLDAHR